MNRRTFATSAAALATVAASATRLIAQAANVPPPRRGYVVRKGHNRFDEQTRLIGQSPIDIKVSGRDTGGAVSVSEYTGYVRGGPPLHVHPAQDEMFFILEGEQLFQLGDEQFRLTPGDSVFIPRGTPHAPAQLSAQSRYVYVFNPAGTMEDFFRALSALHGPPTTAEAAALFEAHGMKIVGPPLAV